jgi:hypothetical protein
VRDHRGARGRTRAGDREVAGGLTLGLLAVVGPTTERSCAKSACCCVASTRNDRERELEIAAYVLGARSQQRVADVARRGLAVDDRGALGPQRLHQPYNGRRRHASKFASTSRVVASRLGHATPWVSDESSHHGVLVTSAKIFRRSARVDSRVNNARKTQSCGLTVADGGVLPK